MDVSQINLIVSQFPNMENPTFQQMTLAYYARDVQMQQQFNDVVQHCIDKLRLNPANYLNYIKQKFSYEQQINLNNYMQQPNGEGYVVRFDDNYINTNLNSPEFQEKENKYNQILEYVNNGGTHEHFYELFTIDELIYLGW